MAHLVSWLQLAEPAGTVDLPDSIACVIHCESFPLGSTASKTLRTANEEYSQDDFAKVSLIRATVSRVGTLRLATSIIVAVVIQRPYMRRQVYVP